MALDALLLLEIRLLAAAGALTVLSVALTWAAWRSTSRTLRSAAEP